MEPGHHGAAAQLPAPRSHGGFDTVLWAPDFEDPELWPVLARD
ncbi:hypothetical protein [Streptomyces sp. LN785]